MKKSLLITTSLLTLGVVTGIYAQTTGATGTIVDKMKAVAHSFTLSASLNPTDTGLSSDPIKGKKTGDILTAGEYNRILELISEGGGGGGSDWVNVPLTDTTDFDTSCEYKFGIDFIADDINRRWMNDNKAVGYSSLVSNKFLFEVLTGNVVLGIPSSNKDQYGTRDSAGVFTSYTNVKITSISKKCGGAGGTSGNITQAGPIYINPDNTDFAPLECTPGVTYMINPIVYSAASASTYTDKKLAILKPGNWKLTGSGFLRIRNIDSGSSQTLRVSTVMDGIATHLLNNTLDIGFYTNQVSSSFSVPANKTIDLQVSIRNNDLRGGNIVLWCAN